MNSTHLSCKVFHITLTQSWWKQQRAAVQWQDICGV